MSNILQYARRPSAYVDPRAPLDFAPRRMDDAQATIEMLDEYEARVAELEQVNADLKSISTCALLAFATTVLGIIIAIHWIVP